MFEYVDWNTGGNRHMEFVRSIFVDTSDQWESEKESTTTLDELLAYFFNEEE